ncbi:MAG: SUF system NifU family Fe-S cluster assembly protein [Candidatus Obscuribacterales bacterium]|nr:SUF system NifU family Fe-S cluster assembly protein [Candidatus Obscuribacterales bacterium]
MSLSDELYRETILDHYHNPRNQGTLEGDKVLSVEGVNPLCGDELVLYLKVENDKVVDLAIKSRGCSINTASCSMMTEAVKGQSLAQVEEMIETFKNMMMKPEVQDIPEEFEDLEALQGVKKYPVRIKCALLPWNTLIEGLRCAESRASGSTEGPKTVSTE